MPKRVIATEAALALIERLKARHGKELMFFQSSGCCDGSAPMCYLVGELTPGRYDLLLLPPSAFFLIGLLIWALRTWRTEQLEKPAFRMAPQVVEKEAY